MKLFFTLSMFFFFSLKMSAQICKNSVAVISTVADEANIFAVDDVSQYCEAGRTYRTTTLPCPINEIVLYPNPTLDILYIRGKNTEGVVRIFNNLGQLLKRTIESEIDMSDFQSGVYFFEIEKQIFKVVKQ